LLINVACTDGASDIDRRLVLTLLAGSRNMVGMKITILFAALFATLGLCASSIAQEPVKAAADIDALFKDKNPRVNAIKQVAYHIEKELLQCNYWDQADPWLTERYVQHNPLVASGRAAVVKFFGSDPNRPRKAACERLQAPVVAVLADGDLVTVVTVASRKDSKGQPYTTTWFDMWRIVDGKADEHWDPQTKP
jgi:predicted SnoaL-like aldol condensation-catalyzing enzyme